MRLPSLKFLKTFQIAAVHQSFKAAAEELCITPSAVSHQVKLLETQLEQIGREREQIAQLKVHALKPGGDAGSSPCG